MNSAFDLLSRLQRTGVKVGTDDDELRYSGADGNLTRELLKQSHEHKPALIDLMSAATASQLPPVEAVSRAGNLPLSFAQQRLWFIDQLEPDRPTYNVPLAFHLAGPLDVTTLERCIGEIVRRHEVLRTTFSVLEGQPAQRVGRATSLTLPVTDISSLKAAERDRQVRRLLTEEARRPFDLSQDLMVRAGLLRLKDQKHIFFLTFHHIAADDWSLEIFLRELSALYAAFSRGQSSSLDELPIQYSDFAVWKRGWLQGEVLEKQLSYWRNQLAGAPTVLELPTDRPRPALQSHRGAVARGELSKPLTAALEELSRAEGATLFMTLLAAFQTLLHRYTGTEDIVLGSPIAGRNRAEIEPLMGCFVNTLVIRGDLSGNHSFRTHLGLTRDVVLEAYAHQDLPFERLVEELHPQRDMSRAPIFQVMFVLENNPSEAAALAELEVAPIPVDNGTAKFDLTLVVGKRVGSLQFETEYSTDLFDAPTIDRMMGHFQTLLEAIVFNPDQRLSDLPLLSEAERRQLLVEWNDTTSSATSEERINQLVELQVQESPDAVALQFGGKALTYRQLNNRANQLARYLRGLGVGPEVCVGVCLERSLDMVVGLLGILKSGGAYVPLDPAYPRDRVAFMLTDSRAPVLLTQRKLIASLPAHSAKIVFLDEDWPLIGELSDGDLTPAAGPTNLAYVIYTSGSTGIPKGVAIEHKSAVNFIRWAQGVFDAEALDGVLAATSICFDLSIFELFVPLSSGGRVVIVENALELRDLPPQSKIRLINTVPSAISELLRLDAIPDSVVTVNLAGEPLSTGLVNDLYQRSNVKKVYDLYGPSETTTYSTYALRLPNVTATIGRPIAATQVYVLDQKLQSVPAGVPGELYIGGAGLARGYLHRPALTAEKFIASPVPGAPSSRLYRTGDQVRFRSDGNLEYLGRLDHQVKIRGFRIELGEIETCLRRHFAIQDVVVISREDVPGEKRLVAYLVTKDAEDLPPVENLVGHLKQSLPEYMVPAVFLTLDALPLTPNGKLDRKALPAPDVARTMVEQAYVAPRHPSRMHLRESGPRRWG